MNYNDDIIDSRDLYTRQCELQALKEARTDTESAYEDALQTLQDAEDDETKFEAQQDVDGALVNLKDAQDEFGIPEMDELAMLDNLENEIDNFMHGTTLIRDRYFETYAQQYAEDIGAIDRDMKWPYTCIDWAQAADELKSDFTMVEIDGTDYYYS